MDNTLKKFGDAVLVSSLEWREKLVLIAMIYHMDFKTHETYIGKPELARQCGLGDRSTVRKAQEKLESWGVITKVGEQPLNPFETARFTYRYRINLTRILELGSSRLPTMGSSEPLGSSELLDHSEGANGGGCGVDLSEASSKRDPYCTVPNGAVRPSDEDEKDRKQHQPLGTSSRTQPGDLLGPRTPAAGVGDAEEAPPFQENPTPAPISDEDAADLILILSHAAANCGIPYEPEESFHFAGDPAMVALLMWWAFGLSDYWIKPEAWEKYGGLSMGTFLGLVPTIDNQFSKWRQRPGLEKKLCSIQAVKKVLKIDDACPDSPEGECVWDDYMLPEGPSHTVDRCAYCGKFRTKPGVNRWTATDDLEAEYMELIECSPCVYDPVLNEWIS